MLSIEKCVSRPGKMKCAGTNETNTFFENTRISVFISELRVALEIFPDNQKIGDYMIDGKYYPIAKLTKQLDSRMMS